MTDTLETTVTETLQTVAAVENKTTELENFVQSGYRGEVGPHNMKGLFHSFLRQGRKNNGISLKNFARKVIAENLIPEEVELAQAWFDRKQGKDKKADRARRQKNKGATLVAIRLATKSARRGKK